MLPAEIVHHIWLPPRLSAEAKYDGQSLQEAKIIGLVYTLCLRGCSEWLSSLIHFAF